MQVSAINFKGCRDNADAYINMDNAALSRAAYLKTVNSIDLKKHKRLDNALTMALPVAGGLAWASRLPKGFRGSGFVTGVLDWGLFLAGAGIASNVINRVNEKCDSVKNFTENHKLFSTLGSFALAITAGIGLQRGGFKLISKALNSLNYEKLAVKEAKLTKKFPKISKFFKKANNTVAGNLSKLHPAIKDTIKWAAGISPWAVIFGSIAHSLNHSSAVNGTYCKNFSEMKEKQLELARLKNRELALQNDFFLTNPKNKEDLEKFKAFCKM